MMTLLTPENLGTGIAVVLFYMSARSLLLLGLMFGLVHLTGWGQKRRVYRLPYSPGQLRKEAISNVKVVALDAILFIAVMSVPGVKFASFTWSRLFLTYASIYVFYEAWFYFTHRLMHLPSLYFIHRQHHVAKVTSPLSALSFSMIERSVLFVGAFLIPTIAAQFVPFICLEGVLLYSLMNLIINLMGHSNVEFYAPDFGSKWMSKIVSGATFHSLHHARQGGHYGLFTSILDRACGTYYADYPAVLQRAAEGQGLTKLTERVSTARPNPQGQASAANASSC